MHLKTRNVNTAFVELVTLFKDGEQNNTETFHRGINPITKTSSRNGPVLQIMEPVIITFEKPNERVLFNQARDANPFLHIFESLWMLAGCNDVAPLAYYAPNMANYSDDGETLNGAYGYRWRRAKTFLPIPPGDPFVKGEFDQLAIIINHLKAKPDSRRAVLQMWNVEDDLLKMDASKDICCNTSVMFSIRNEEWKCDCSEDQKGEYDGQPSPEHQKHLKGKKYLDMTVINRSNDLVWGMLGANVVHFSFLQEYMAARIGVEVGVYNQMSNNLHIYTENNSGFKHEEWLADETPKYYLRDQRPDGLAQVKKVPLVQSPAVFEEELPRFVASFAENPKAASNLNWQEPFLQSVASPMLRAFILHKERLYDGSLSTIREVKADDWRIAGANWITKRKLTWKLSKGVM